MKISREIKVMCDMPRDSMPRDVIAALSPEEVDAFFNHREYFGLLAAQAVHPDIKRYLEHIAGLDVFHMTLYSADEAPFAAYFHHTVVEAAESVSIRLPRPQAAPANLPEELRPIYRSLGGLRREFGGLLCPEEIRSVAESDCWISDDNALDPSQCFLFYDFGDGDALGFASSGDGVLYEGESGVLSPADLEAFTSEGFQEFLPD